jgi:hypothetical protein
MLKSSVNILVAPIALVYFVSAVLASLAVGSLHRRKVKRR